MIHVVDNVGEVTERGDVPLLNQPQQTKRSILQPCTLLAVLAVVALLVGDSLGPSRHTEEGVQLITVSGQATRVVTSAIPGTVGRAPIVPPRLPNFKAAEKFVAPQVARPGKSALPPVAGRVEASAQQGNLELPSSEEVPIEVVHKPATGWMFASVTSMAYVVASVLGVLAFKFHHSGQKEIPKLALMAVGEAPTQPPPPKFQRLFMALRDVTLWFVLYFWFFKISNGQSFVANKFPHFAETWLTLTALFPLLVLKYANGSVERVFRAFSKVFKGLPVISHAISTAISPFTWAVRSILVFFSINMFVNAVPVKTEFRLPSGWEFIDPNKDGILTALELKNQIHAFSPPVLFAILTSLLVAYFLAVKKHPEDMTSIKEKQEHNFLYSYWLALSESRGLPVVLDLVLSIAAISLAALKWFQVLGLRPEAVLTFGGVGGLALGVASQNVVSNVVSGLLIIVTQPFLVGDEIEHGGSTGIIKEIGWANTKVETDEGSIIILPNHSLIATETVNLSLGNRREMEFRLPVLLPEYFDATKLESVSEYVKAQMSPLKGLIVEGPTVLLDYNIKAVPVCAGPQLVFSTVFDSKQVSRDEMEEIQSRLTLDLITWLPLQGLAVKNTFVPAPVAPKKKTPIGGV